MSRGLVRVSRDTFTGVLGDILVFYEFDRDGDHSFQLARDEKTDSYFARTVLMPSGRVLFHRQVPGASSVGTYLVARRRAEIIGTTTNSGRKRSDDRT